MPVSLRLWCSSVVDDFRLKRKFKSSFMKKKSSGSKHQQSKKINKRIVFYKRNKWLIGITLASICPKVRQVLRYYGCHKMSSLYCKLSNLTTRFFLIYTMYLYTVCIQYPLFIRISFFPEFLLCSFLHDQIM